jgi:U2 small nuclear ribonucleoprotein B''
MLGDSMMETQHTLYVNNLYENLKTDGKYPFAFNLSVTIRSHWLLSICRFHPRVCLLRAASAELSKSMRAIFGQFGNIIDVVCRDTYKLRGQAWVVFEHEEDAAKALEKMQGFPFFNKPIRIAYAKTKSDAAAKLDGTYSEEQAEARKQRRRQMWAARKEATTGEAGGAAATPAATAPAATSNLILFVENLPAEANEAMLLLVFQRYPGLKEVRMVPGRPGIAFVEYDNEGGAAAAMAGLQGFRLATDKPMQLSFAKQ